MVLLLLLPLLPAPVQKGLRKSSRLVASLFGDCTDHRSQQGVGRVNFPGPAFEKSETAKLAGSRTPRGLTSYKKSHLLGQS